MANPMKGEVAFEFQGATFKFVLGTYALAYLQRRSGKSTVKFFSRSAGDWGIDDVLAVFHAGLLRHHELSEKQAADLIDELGQAKVGELIAEAVKLAFPSAEGASKGTARPPKASGASSSS
jgi:hypothetical protein